MSNGTAAGFTFLSHLRRGLSTGLEHTDAATAPARAVFPVTVELGPGRSVDTTVELYGPGDVTGIDPAEILRTDPKPGTVDFEANYFPLVEFDAADLPWRFTPTAPAGGRLRPWLCLAVMTEAEFEWLPTGRRPLPAIRVLEPPASLPELEDSWAWCHVQVAERLDGPDAEVEAALRERLSGAPERLVSRILCPRRLRPLVDYRAFVVPTTEPGRRAGLGEDPDGAAPVPAWTDGSTGPLELPVYHEWSFRTGEAGDFESLVRRLQPRTLGGRIGLSAFLARDPGYGLPGIADQLDFEGALKTPAARPTGWTGSAAFRAALTDLLNLAEALRAGDASTAPIVGPPIWGQQPAGRKTVGQDSPPWLDELNLDPRLRAAAGLGAQVVQGLQGPLLASVWRQVGDAVTANQHLVHGLLGERASLALYRKGFIGLDDDRLVSLTARLHHRILGSPVTVGRLLDDSPVPRVALSGAFRRLARPRGPLGRRLGITGRERLVARLNDGSVAAAGPPPPRPAGTSTLDSAAERFLPSRWPPRYQRLLPFLPLLLALLGALLAWTLAAGRRGGRNRLAAAVATVGAVASGATARPARWWSEALKMTRGRLTPRATTAAPGRPDFTVTTPGQPLPSKRRGPDSPEAVAFRAAALDVQRRLHMPVRSTPPRRPVDFNSVASTILTALEPRATIPPAVLAGIEFHRSGLRASEDPLGPVEVAPEFEQPMYEPLRDLSQDYLLPGAGSVPNNTVALLETNRRFVEAYMVGVNHEAARTFLAHECPVDLGATYSRQFWDVRSALPPAGVDPAAWRESAKDIAPIRSWRALLGRNDVESRGEQLVLLIRGDLLRRYPTTAIYAAKAKWNPNANQGRGGRDLDTGTPPKPPIFRGALPPDMTFLGFDITAEDALGSTNPGGDQGYFFVFSELHAEVRFGADSADGPVPEALDDWADLSWGHLARTADVFEALGYIRLDRHGPPGGSRAQPVWGAGGAEMAVITMQQPFRMAVHAGRMLPDEA